MSVASQAIMKPGAALTLVQAVLPKDLWLADRQLEVPWPMWGLPDGAFVEDALSFKDARESVEDFESEK